jgi:hypothetical protein
MTRISGVIGDTRGCPAPGDRCQRGDASIGTDDNEVVESSDEGVQRGFESAHEDWGRRWRDPNERSQWEEPDRQATRFPRWAL